MIASTADELGHVFKRRVLLPLLLATAVAVLLAGLALFMVTHHSDAVAIDRQIREAKIAVNASIDELARSQEIAAVWDQSVVELRKPRPNWQWMDDNVGTWLFNMFNHDEVYILDADDRPIYATSSGRRIDPARYSSVSGTMGHFVDAVRGRIADRNNTHERLPGMPSHPQSTVRTSPAAVHATELTWIHERPAAVSVMRMVPLTPAVERTPGKEPLIVSVRFLDGNLLTELESRNLMSSPRLSASPDLRPGEQEFELQSDHGSVGHFIWRPELPATSMRG